MALKFRPRRPTKILCCRALFSSQQHRTIKHGEGASEPPLPIVSYDVYYEDLLPLHFSPQFISTISSWACLYFQLHAQSPTREKISSFLLSCKSFLHICIQLQSQDGSQKEGRGEESASWATREQPEEWDRMWELPRTRANGELTNF